MILTCNSCSKKFVVPDNAITASGRMVQCGSCGNKWKQFPVGEVKKTQSISRTKKSSFKTSANYNKKYKNQKKKKRLLQKNQEKSVCTHLNI